MGQIVLFLEIFNFKPFRAEILQMFELLIWKINDFINSFQLYPTVKEQSRAYCPNIYCVKREAGKV